MCGVCLLSSGPQRRGLWREEAPGRLGLSLRSHLAMVRLPCKSPRKSPKRPCDPSLLPRRFAPLPPIPARRALLSVTQTRGYLGRSTACSARGTPRLAHCPLGKTVTAPAGLSRNQPPRREGRRGARAGGGRSGSQTRLGRISAQDRAGEVECARALRPPGFGKRCAAESRLGRGSLPGPFLPTPSPGTGGSSPRPVPPGLKPRAWLLP